MKTFYKYIVIGAGPSGMACAISLRKQGEVPCVIDKASFPRDKTCGGLVTEKTYRLIRRLLEKNDDKLQTLFCHTASDASLFIRGEKLVQTPFEKPVRFVKRASFDAELVKSYRAAGGTILEDCGNYTLDYPNRRILFENGDVLQYEYLVLADGAFSQSRKLLSADMADLTFGLETFLPAEKFPIAQVQLHFGYVKNGYIWVFPYDDVVCVGVGANYQKGLGYKKILQTFLKDQGVDPRGLHFEGAFLPGGVPVMQNRLSDSVLLVGDAAGFADPISGEGLFFALLSGIAAAKALQGEFPKQQYLSSIRPVVKLLNEGRSLQKFFYRPSVQRYFIRHVRNNRAFVRHYFDRQVSEYGYPYQKIFRLYLDYKLHKKK